jgi:hypothetical protein
MMSKEPKAIDVIPGLNCDSGFAFGTGQPDMAGILSGELGKGEVEI